MIVKGNLNALTESERKTKIAQAKHGKALMLLMMVFWVRDCSFENFLMMLEFSNWWWRGYGID